MPTVELADTIVRSSTRTVHWNSRVALLTDEAGEGSWEYGDVWQMTTPASTLTDIKELIKKILGSDGAELARHVPTIEER